MASLACRLTYGLAWRCPRGAAWVLQGVLIAALLWGVSSRCFGQDAAAADEAVPGDSLSQQLATQFVTLFRQNAETDARYQYQREITVQLQAGQLKLPALSGKMDAQWKEAIDRILESNLSPLESKLQIYSGQQQADVQKLADEWLDVRARLTEAEGQLAETQAVATRAGQLASLMSVDNRFFWLSGFVALVALVTVSLHDRRHEVRRRMKGSKAREMRLSWMLNILMAVIGVATVVTFIFGPMIINLILGSSGQAVRSFEKLKQENTVLQKKSDELTKRLQQQSGELTVRETQWTEGGTQPQRWKKIRQELENSYVAMATKEQLVKAIQEDVQRLEGVESEKIKHAGAIANATWTRRIIRCGMGFGLLSVAGCGALLLLRGIRHRRRKTEETCPQCMAEGKLEDDQAAQRGVPMIKCTNVISEQPYEECNFTFETMYQAMTKLCFPTLGIPTSGKTHWLSMVYRELNRGNYSNQVQFHKVRSEQSDVFDTLVEEIIGARIGTAATQTQFIPRPLVFNFLDRDRLGKSDVLVNIFDYSGEIMSHSLDSSHRRRALEADGYIFFIDPTTEADQQVRALDDFYNDVKIVKKVRPGQPILAPVALCIPKIDLLPNQPYADPDGGGEVGRFYDKLREIDEKYDHMSLELIRQRSELASRLRDTVWPGWQVETKINELFGGRSMFFPLTPVGLGNAGESDLSRVVIEPYGIVEPLVWLLHMNGYPVLNR
jgi:hypothetical protein